MIDLHTLRARSTVRSAAAKFLRQDLDTRRLTDRSRFA
jgi:hypothetical protein